MEFIAPDSFLDRFDDRRTLDNFVMEEVDLSPRVMLLKSGAASGTTHFLRMATRAYAEKDHVTVYADLQTDNLLAILEKYFAEHSKVFTHRLCAFLNFRKIFPFFIKLFGHVSQQPYGRTVAVGAERVAGLLLDTPYHSAPLQRFAEESSCRLGKRKILFLVDNAQDNFHKLEDLLRSTYAPEYGHIQFVVSYIERDKNEYDYSNFVQRIRATGHRILAETFSEPNDELIAAFSHAYQMELSYNERLNLLASAQGNIWSIRDFFALQEKAKSISHNEQYVLKLLLVAQQPIQLSDIRIIGNDSPLIVTAGEKNWENIISSLEKRNFIRLSDFDGSDRLVSLGIATHKSLDISQTEKLVIAQELYDYFVIAAELELRRHAPSAIHALLYRLSKIVADSQERAKWANCLVKAALEQGSLSDAKRYISAAGLAKLSTREDLLIQIAFHASVQNYEAVLDNLQDSLPLWQNHRIFEIIHAVSLNRTRCHEMSFQKLNELLSSAELSDEIALLLSYKIVGLLHCDRMQEAAECVQTAPIEIKDSHGYGYFLRNAAAAFMWGACKDLSRAREMLNESEKYLLFKQDQFGALTAQHNRACVDFYEGRIQDVYRAFESLYKKIRIFGTQHIEEIGTNLGILRLLIGKLNECREHLLTICNIIDWDYPRCIAESALAFVEARLGNKSAAQLRIDDVLRNVRCIEISELRMRVETNAVLIDVMTGRNVNSTNSRIEILRTSYGNRNRYIILEKLLDKPNDKDLQLKSFDFDLCQYWSQNPLAMISDISLSS